jgi:hypothetical protein
MTDVVIKSIEEFKRDEISSDKIHIYNDILNKYSQLFLTYDCFSNKNIPSTFQPAKTNSGGGRGFPRRIEKERKRRERTINESILGIINIINLSNYAKMLNTIRCLSNQSNISTIINEILIRTCYNSFYLDLFTKLISDLASISGYKDNIIDEISLFIEKFIKCEEYLFHPKEADSSDYDIFCDEQKHKSYVLCKNNLILNLHKNGIFSINIQDYINHFMSIIEKGREYDEYHKTLLLQLLIDCLKYDIPYNKGEFNNVLVHLNDHNWICNKKLEFLAKELSSKVDYM